MSPLARWYKGRDDRVTRDERLLQRIPAALLDYPLESALGAWGVLSGPPRVLFPRQAGTVDQLLPVWGVVLFSGLMTLGGLTTLWGLRSRRYGSTVARGLELLGTTFACYAVALFASWSLSAVLLAMLLVFLAALSWLRAWVLVLRARVIRRGEASTQRTLRRFDEKAGTPEEPT